MKTRVKAKAAAVTAADTGFDPESYFKNRKQLGERAAAKIRSGEAKPLTEAMIAERIKAAKQSRSITIRLPEADIERAKERAEKLGIGYQTYIKSLIHQALDSAR